MEWNGDARLHLCAALEGGSRECLLCGSRECLLCGSSECLLCGGRRPHESSRAVGIVDERSTMLVLLWLPQLTTETHKFLSVLLCLSDCRFLCTGASPTIPPLMSSRLMLF